MARDEAGSGAAQGCRFITQRKTRLWRCAIIRQTNPPTAEFIRDDDDEATVLKKTSQDHMSLS